MNLKDTKIPARVMLVEDDVNLSFVTQDNLEKQGFKVFAYEDGLSALEAFEAGQFDICILDVMLPKLDGFSLAKAIRERNDNVPVIFLTAKSLKEDKIAGLTLGADDYITKPFSIEELILKVQVFLRRSGQTAALPNKNIFHIGAYSFDFNELQLKTENDAPVKLTLKEAELLRYFCNNQNKVMKREEILKSIWGDDDYFIGRSLDVFISRLRKYLSNDTSIHIENIHGIGFRMEVR